MHAHAGEAISISITGGMLAYIPTCSCIDNAKRMPDSVPESDSTSTAESGKCPV